MSVTITACKPTMNDEATVSDSSSGETRYFLVTVTETDVTPWEVVRAAYTPDAPAIADGSVAAPQYNQAHAIDASLSVRSKNAKRVTANGKFHPNQWIVTAQYGYPSVSTQAPPAAGATENSRNIIVRVSGVESTIYTQKPVAESPDDDDDVDPIRNAADDLYPDPQEVTLYDEAISISFETDSIDQDGVAEARGRINSGTVTLTLPQGSGTFAREFAAHTLLLKTADYQAVVDREDSENSKLSVEIVLLYRKETWLRKLPQKGYRFYIDTDGDKTISEPQPTPVWLDAEGYKLEDDATLVSTDPIRLNYNADLAAILGSI